jgi:hypothetical protein
MGPGEREENFKSPPIGFSSGLIFPAFVRQILNGNLAVRVNRVEIKLDKEEKKKRKPEGNKDLNSQREWHLSRTQKISPGGSHAGVCWLYEH